MQASKVRIDSCPMPIFFQHTVNDSTRIGVWKIEESEGFFKDSVPVHREVSHPHKRLQHLAGRFLLRYLFPSFPYELIQIADTRKPYLPNDAFHFSISHCGDFAAVIISPDQRVGIDIEKPVGKLEALKEKFSTQEERALFPDEGLSNLTLIWSAKETVFKWYGKGQVDFREHIQLEKYDPVNQQITGFFTKTDLHFEITYTWLEGLAVCWLVTENED